MTSVTVGLPSVSVPVLSKMMAWMRDACSSAVAFLIRIPCRAPIPVATATAVGVARPSASGQAITTAVTASVRAKSAVWWMTKNHTRKVDRPAPTAKSTRYCAARSARRWAGAFEFCAVCTSWTIWASAVSAPTRVARTRSDPLPLTVPPITSSPGALPTGRLSPVIMLSSTALAPAMTTPSTGTFSPGRTSSRSPTRTSSTGTVRTCPSGPTTLACAGARRSRAFSASEEPRRLRISIQWPNRTKVTNIAAASKVVSTLGANSVANALKR